MMEIYVIILFSVSILLVFIHSLTRASGHEVSVERERISSL